MRKINIKLSTCEYNIYIEGNIISNIASYIEGIYNGDRIFIITDENVKALYLNKVVDALGNRYRVEHIAIAPGEASKSITSYIEISTRLLELECRRGDLLIALGGGVVGDLCGFVASTLYRGIPYVSIPTSLLSQMDSSIGGKTGIDFYNRKNILGSFYQPKMVLIDPEVLNTLPKRELSNGSAELIKHAIIGDSSLLELLNNSSKIDEEIVYKSLMVKARIVMRDEYDTKDRMILNFGHTFAHALELKLGYLHGEAVAIGILMALRLGIALGITNKNIYLPIKELLAKYGLPTIEYDYKDYLKEAIYDKKNIAGVISFILVKDYNEPIIYKINVSRLKELL